MKDLISAIQLKDLLNDKHLTLLDCRANLTDRHQSYADYLKGHIANAIFADLESDLSNPKIPNHGRHPLPYHEDWQNTLRNWGIHSDSKIVVYDQSNGMFACRAWWMLKACGLNNVAVLDGGLQGWLRQGYSLSTEHAKPSESNLIIHPFKGIVEEGALKTTTHNTALLDARASDRYLGKSEPLDKAAGHIPTAINAEFTANLDENGFFKSTKLLQQRFSGITEKQQIICYCGSGVTACHNIFSLALAGFSNVYLFPGSWSQWCANPDNPIETQPEGTL